MDNSPSQPPQPSPDIDRGAISVPPTKDYNGLEIISTPDLQRLLRRLRAAVWWIRKIMAWMRRHCWYCHDTLYRHLKTAAAELEQVTFEIDRDLGYRVEAERKRRNAPVYEEAIKRTPETDEWLRS